MSEKPSHQIINPIVVNQVAFCIRLQKSLYKKNISVNNVEIKKMHFFKIHLRQT